MNNRWLQISEEVFAELQKHAEPLVDNGDSVLRRVLGLDPSSKNADRDGPAKSEPVADSANTQASRKTGVPQSKAGNRGRIRAPKARKPERARKGSLLPEEDYVVPLLEVLMELGGSAPVSRVVELLESRLDGKLTATDRKTLSSGKVRWKSRVQFVRLSLIREGYMAREAPRGIWEITDEGRAYVSNQGDQDG